MGSKVLLVAWEHDLHVVRVVEAAFTGAIEEFDQVLAAHIADLFGPIVSVLKSVTPFLTYLMNWAKSREVT